VASRVTDTQFWAAAGIATPGNIIDPRIVFIPNAGQGGQAIMITRQFAKVSLPIQSVEPSEGAGRRCSGRVRGLGRACALFSLIGI